MSKFLSHLNNVQFVSAKSPEELQEILRKLPGPFNIQAWYAKGDRHFVWITGDVKILKKNKGVKNVSSS